MARHWEEAAVAGEMVRETVLGLRQVGRISPWRALQSMGRNLTFKNV